MACKVARAATRRQGPEAVAELTEGLRRDLHHAAPRLIAVFSSSPRDLSEILSALTDEFRGALVVGTSTSGEFTEQAESLGGIVALALAGDLEVHAGFARGLREDVMGTVTRAVHGLPTFHEKYANRAALVFFDGLAGVGEAATLHVALALGGIRVTGGAAGTDFVTTSTSVGLGHQAATDAMVVITIFSADPIGIGVKHGHEPLTAPTKVTRSLRNVVYELDGKPAWQRYVEMTRAHAIANYGIDPAADASVGERLRFFARYQTGLQNGDEHRVRTPTFITPSGAIEFAADVPVGTIFKVLTSTREAQIGSARAAARAARESLGDAEPIGALVIDCACRKIFLGDDFIQAARGISEELGGVPIAGFESYGEVALDVADYSGFHNATTVVLTFGASGSRLP